LGLPQDADHGDAVGAGDDHEVEAHPLTQFEKLIFDRAACVVVVGIGAEQHHARLEGGVLAGDAEKAAVMQCALRMHCGQRHLPFVQCGAQAVAHRRIHQVPHHPEAAQEQHGEGYKAEQERAGAQVGFHCDAPATAKLGWRWIGAVKICGRGCLRIARTRLRTVDPS
jgi:hypothetical protein